MYISKFDLESDELIMEHKQQINPSSISVFDGPTILLSLSNGNFISLQKSFNDNYEMNEFNLESKNTYDFTLLGISDDKYIGKAKFKHQNLPKYFNNLNDIYKFMDQFPIFSMKSLKPNSNSNIINTIFNKSIDSYQFVSFDLESEMNLQKWELIPNILINNCRLLKSYYTYHENDSNLHHLLCTDNELIHIKDSVALWSCQIHSIVKIDIAYATLNNDPIILVTSEKYSYIVSSSNGEILESYDTDLTIIGNFSYDGFDQILYFYDISYQSKQISLKHKFSRINEPIQDMDVEDNEHSEKLLSITYALRTNLNLVKEQIKQLNKSIIDKEKIFENASVVLSNFTKSTAKRHSFINKNDLVQFNFGDPINYKDDMIIGGAISINVISAHHFVDESVHYFQIKFVNHSKNSVYFQSLIPSCSAHTIRSESSSIKLNPMEEGKITASIEKNLFPFNDNHMIVHIYLEYKQDNEKNYSITHIGYFVFNCGILNNSSTFISPLSPPKRADFMISSDRKEIFDTISLLLEERLNFTKNDLNHNKVSFESQDHHIKTDLIHHTEGVELRVYSLKEEYIKELIKFIILNTKEIASLTPSILTENHISGFKQFLSSLKEEIRLLDQIKDMMNKTTNLDEIMNWKILLLEKQSNTDKAFSDLLSII